MTLDRKGAIPHELLSLLDYASGAGKQVLSPSEYLARKMEQA